MYIVNSRATTKKVLKSSKTDTLRRKRKWNHEMLNYIHKRWKKTGRQKEEQTTTITKRATNRKQ